MKKSISIIGVGRLGKALAVALKNAGLLVKSVYGKHDEIKDLGTIVFITTPDSEIRTIDKSIVSQFDDLSEKSFIHCSGAFSSSILDQLSKKSAGIGCFHPLQSVTNVTRDFEGIYFDIEGDEEVKDVLEEIATSLGAKTIRVSESEKEMLHVSAVMASNYLVTLSDIALRTSEATNLSKRTLMDAMLPLMKSTLTNLEELSPSEALTGPIARGDIQTVQAHLKLLEKDKDLLDIYKKLGLLTLELISTELEDNSVKFRLYDLLK